MKTKISIAIAIVALLAIIGAWYWRADPSKANHSTDGENAAAPSTAAQPKQRVPSAPLPPLDVPLKQQLSLLKARADQGDPAAACRLAAEYAYCDRLKYRQAEDARWLSERQYAIDLIDDPQVKADAAASVEREIAVREQNIKPLLEHCADITEPSPAQMAQMWRRAALLGDPAAVKHYASGNAFRWESVFHTIPQLTLYRGEAEKMAWQVAQEGDAEMMLALAAGYDPSPTRQRSLLAQTLKPDGAMSLAIYTRLMDSFRNSDRPELDPLRRAITQRVADLRSDLSADQLSRADQLYRSTTSEWKVGVPTDERLDISGGQREIHRRVCGSGERTGS